MSTPNPVLDSKEWQAPVKGGPTGPILRAEDLQLWSNAQSYLAAAKQALENARQRADEFVASERQRGYKEGWQAGSKDVFDFLAQTKRAVGAYYEQLETNLRELAIQVVKQVIDDLEASDAVALAVRKALKTPNLGAEVTLFVAPSVLPEIRKKLEGRLSHATTSKITLREDPQLAPTECRLASEFCVMDLSLDKQLDLLADSLRASNIGVRG